MVEKKNSPVFDESTAQLVNPGDTSPEVVTDSEGNKHVLVDNPAVQPQSTMSISNVDVSKVDSDEVPPNDPATDPFGTRFKLTADELSESFSKDVPDKDVPDKDVPDKDKK